MPITQVSNIVRVTFRFNLFNGAGAGDIADCGVCYKSDENPSDDATWDLILNDMAVAATASWHTNVDKEFFHPSISLGSVRVAHEATNGHTLHEKIAPANSPNDWAGSSTSPSLPWDNAICLSLYAYAAGTFTPNGRSKRGRMYLPAPATNLITNNDTGQPSIGNLVLIMNGVGQVLQELQQHDYTGFPAFVPILGVNSREMEEFFPVQTLRVDNRFDSQRRRINALVPDIATAPYPHT